MDRANDIFDQIDTDKSGGIDKGEVTIRLLWRWVTVAAAVRRSKARRGARCAQNARMPGCMCGKVCPTLSF